MAANRQDVDRFYRLLWPHRESVLRTARLLVRDPATADDLAQETMLKGFRSVRQFADGTNARSWLLSILRNARIDWLRSESRRRNDVSLNESLQALECSTPDGEMAVVAEGHGAEQLLDRLGDADLITALQALPEEIRWTVLLVEVDGLDHADAAVVLGVPVGTIKSRASRGRSMLRSLLEPIAMERGWTRERDISATDTSDEIARPELGGAR